MERSLIHILLNRLALCNVYVERAVARISCPERLASPGLATAHILIWGRGPGQWRARHLPTLPTLPTLPRISRGFSPDAADTGHNVPVIISGE